MGGPRDAAHGFFVLHRAMEAHLAMALLFGGAYEMVIVMKKDAT